MLDSYPLMRSEASYSREIVRLGLRPTGGTGSQTLSIRTAKIADARGATPCTRGI